MKTKNMLTLILLVVFSGMVQAQSGKRIKLNTRQWSAFSREVIYKDDVIYLNAEENDGKLWLKDYIFSNGTIELDIKGKDERGKSFVGIAFHANGNETFDGVYFRPFNFKSPERSAYSVQYISMPDNDWSALRKEFLGKYENKISPAPEPDQWFHAKIIVDYPSVKVYVNGAQKASLEVVQMSDQKEGKLGLWVGNGSDGWFKNIVVRKK
ncbi:MAG: hypothetical protein ACI9GZ_002050 [Bacteroidia bacterium]|jgi:hypothetical protein